MKKILSIVLTALFAGLAFAMPGIPYTDNSGDYVYYRDYSFNRESYIGFLTYDSGTYAARYFAPATEDLAPKNIELLFTVDPDKDYIDMTGERFVTQPTQEDTEIINYIHDLIYEFASRAKKQSVISNTSADSDLKNGSQVREESSVFMKSGIRVSEDFSQFGGQVFVYYDGYIPVFPVKKIISNSQEVLFEAVCIGRITSSDDRSFSDFQIPHNEIKEKKFTHKYKKPKAVTYEVDETKIVLDQNWNRASEDSEESDGNENLFFYGDEAMLFIGTLEGDIQISGIIKSIILQTAGNYVPLSDISIVQENGKTMVCIRCISGDSAYERFVVFSDKNGKRRMLNMVINAKQYDENRKYYRNILKNWK